MKSLWVLFLVLILSFPSCVSNNSKKTIKNTQTVKVDSTLKGIIGKPESSLMVVTRIDTTIIKREENYWDSKYGLSQRVIYFDSLKRKYKQTDFYNYKNENVHSYVWYDTIKGSISNEWIASSDSSFDMSGKIKKVESEYLGTELTEYFNNKGKIYQKDLYSKSLPYRYVEENNNFHCRRTDIPLEYAEWENTSRTEFGMAIEVFYKSQTQAYIYFKKLYNKELD